MPESAVRKSPPQPQVQVLLVDDHPMIREYTARLLDLEPDLAVCAAVADAPSAISAFIENQPDLVILDLALETGHGLELIKDLLALRPHLPIVVLSMHDEEIYAERALRAGALAYVSKRQGADQLVLAARAALAGELFVSDSVSRTLLQKLVSGRGPDTSPAAALSDRELEIFEKLGQGLSVRQISQDLGIHLKTVETHRCRIKDKLDLADANSVLRAAIAWTTTRG